MADTSKRTNGLLNRTAAREILSRAASASNKKRIPTATFDAACNRAETVARRALLSIYFRKEVIE